MNSVHEPLERKPGRSLPLGYQYRGFCGEKAQRRYLKQRWAKIEKLKDPASLEARDRLLDAVCDEPDSEFSAMHLGHVALQAAEETGSTWAESVKVMLDKFNEASKLGDGGGTI